MVASIRTYYFHKPLSSKLSRVHGTRFTMICTVNIIDSRYIN